MAVPKKVVGKKVLQKPTKKVGPKKKSAAKEVKRVRVTLPTKRSKPSRLIGDYTWLIYGEKKIGKTSLVSHFPNCFHLMFEPGGRALSIFQRAIPDWEYFQEYVKLLEKGDHDFRTVCVDTGQMSYDLAFEYACRVYGFQYPSESDYGKDWNKVKRTFQDPHRLLLSLGLGYVVIAHIVEKKIEPRNGPKFDAICPDLSGRAEKFYTGIIDNIAYYHYRGNKRFLQIRGDDYVQAGTRCEENFLTPKGEPVCMIPMGNSSKEAYQNLMKAFNNKQSETYRPAEVKKGVKKTAVKKKVKK